MLAEDNVTNQRVVPGILKKIGVTVDAVENGEAALEVLASCSYDLVLMDCRMLVMDGYEATRRIRRMEGGVRNIPVIALTACAMPGDREKCLEAGIGAERVRSVAFVVENAARNGAMDEAASFAERSSSSSGG